MGNCTTNAVEIFWYSSTMIIGFHHLTLVCSNARRSLRFYTQTLGLRLVKTTVNNDDPAHYHLYFGDQEGKPGTLISVYEWQVSPKGTPGVGGVESVGLGVDNLVEWQKRLEEKGVFYDGPYEKGNQVRICLWDPDGLQIELIDETTTGSTPYIHELSTLSADIEAVQSFYSDLLGMQHLWQAELDGNTCSGWGVGGRLLIRCKQVAPELALPARKGPGMLHHFALGVRDLASLVGIRERLLGADLLVSEILDRTYYQSLLVRDPDGQLLALSTLGPGMLVDEKVDDLGKGLMLPGWLEGNRKEIEENLAYLG